MPDEGEKSMDNRIVEDYLQGASLNAYDFFGAHLTREWDQDGARFSVYAPHASQVSLVGSFNDWQGTDMQRTPEGVWSLFVQGVREMDLYKYRITTADGETYDRADPFAFYSERRPNTASMVFDIDGFPWEDQAWMNSREKNYTKPMNVYEMHLGSWRMQPGEGDERLPNYARIKSQLIPYLKEMGYTHVEFLPLTEYPFDGSWGYQVTGYFSATSRYGDPRQLMDLINCCHQNGIGVILDFVPVHFVRDFYALHQYDGSFLYESENEDQRYSQWGTALFDFSKPHVLSFMKSALHFWISYFHIDGIRYDAVSNLIYRHGEQQLGANEPGIWFLKNVNYALQKKHPDVMLIAEDSSQYLKVTAPVEYGGLGFDYKWDLGWMHDTFDYLELPPSSRGEKHNLITFSMSYFYQEIFILPFSHDEVVHGKKTVIDKLYGTYEEKFAQLRSLYLYMFTHPGKKLNFMGNELAEFKEWDEDKELGWNVLEYDQHRNFHEYLKFLHHLYRKETALFAADYHSEGFEWLDVDNTEQSVYSYRRDDLNGQEVFVVINFSSKNYAHYDLPVREEGNYVELIHTDAEGFGGKGRCNSGVLRTACKDGKTLLRLKLAPYSALMVKKTDKTE